MRTPILALLMVVLALAMPATHAGSEPEPQPLREERATYTLFRPFPFHAWASDPCDQIGGACFAITGNEPYIEIRLKDDFSASVCASVHVWNHDQTEGIITGGCDVVWIPIAQPPAGQEGRVPPNLSQVNVHIRPVDSLILPNLGSLATSGTITLRAYE